MFGCWDFAVEFAGACASVLGGDEVCHSRVVNGLGSGRIEESRQVVPIEVVVRGEDGRRDVVEVEIVDRELAVFPVGCEVFHAEVEGGVLSDDRLCRGAVRVDGRLIAEAAASARGTPAVERLANEGFTRTTSS